MKNVIYFILGSLLVFTSCKKDASNPISPSEDASTVTYSGIVYHKVKIGNQTWLKENLDVGVMIDSLQNPSNNGTIEKYCYGNDTANCNKYGGLYQWNEAMAYDTANGARGICPTGWHIPSRAEFETLAVIANSNSNELKAVGQGTEKGVGTDSLGFSALLAGYNYNLFDTYFLALGIFTGFWSSKVLNSTGAWHISMFSNDHYVYFSGFYKVSSFSIRCIKDN
ncbi:MAG: FISUMP domain-containing protein [Ignavibacteriaceae bacterium]|jgi:uncharacterized protein (TIGR02145 family)